MYCLIVVSNIVEILKWLKQHIDLKIVNDFSKHLVGTYFQIKKLGI